MKYQVVTVPSFGTDAPYFVRRRKGFFHRWEYMPTKKRTLSYTSEKLWFDTDSLAKENISYLLYHCAIDDKSEAFLLMKKLIKLELLKVRVIQEG